MSRSGARRDRLALCSAPRDMSRALALGIARLAARARFAGVLALVAIAWWPRGAWAADIAILQPSRSSAELGEALFRLQGELLALGLEVRVVARPDDTAADAPPAWSESMAAQGVDAVIDVLGDTAPVAVEIWIRERSSPQYRKKRVELESGAANAAETLAIRAIEVLRSSFLEIDLLARGKRRTAESEPPAAEPADSRPPATEGVERLGVEVGPAVLMSFDGVGPALMPLLRLDWALDEAWTADATLAGFGTSPTLEADSGSARVAQQFAVAGLCYCAPHATGVRPIAGVAAGALRTSVAGRADAPERGHTVARWAFLADARVGLRLALPGGYHVALASHLHWAQPYVAIHFVDELLASTGRPNLLFSLTAGAWL